MNNLNKYERKTSHKHFLASNILKIKPNNVRHITMAALEEQQRSGV